MIPRECKDKNCIKHSRKDEYFLCYEQKCINPKCIVCGKDTEEIISINENNGFCEHSYSKPFCNCCYLKSIHKVNDKIFLIINNNLYYEINEKYGLYGTVEKIYSEEQFNYIANKEYFDVLNKLGW